MFEVANSITTESCEDHINTVNAIMNACRPDLPHYNLECDDTRDFETNIRVPQTKTDTKKQKKSRSQNVGKILTQALKEFAGPGDTGDYVIRAENFFTDFSFLVPAVEDETCSVSVMLNRMVKAFKGGGFQTCEVTTPTTSVTTSPTTKTTPTSTHTTSATSSLTTTRTTSQTTTETTTQTTTVFKSQVSCISNYGVYLVGIDQFQVGNEEVYINE